MLIACPLCGPRDATEFRYVDELRHRPDVERTSPQEWRDYLYLRANPAGPARELWLHRMGCRQYLYVDRHTVTNDVQAAVLAREAAEAIPAAEADGIS